MAKTRKYDLGDLFQRAFNFKVKKYENLVAFKLQQELLNPKYNPSVIDFEAAGLSVMGTKLFMPVELDDAVTYGKFKLPDEPIVEIARAKRIVRTEIDGMEGTFKELFGMDDYRITIRGLAIQDDGTDNYPEKIVRSIRDFCEAPNEIKINCKLTTIFRIDNIVITDYEFPPMEGFPGVQPFLLNCLSDTELLLKLDNG